MRIQGRFLIAFSFIFLCLTGCVGPIWTGATTIYDRHNLYLKLKDYHLLVEVNNVLAVNKTFETQGCVLDIAVFNGDILIAGHVLTHELLLELQHRLKQVKGYRRLFIDVSVKQISSNSLQDSWITAKIRSQIFADSSIDPNAFKIVTSDRIVYLMGDVKRDQAIKVIKMARFTSGVARVVKMFKYFSYQ